MLHSLSEFDQVGVGDDLGTEEMESPGSQASYGRPPLILINSSGSADQPSATELACGKINSHAKHTFDMQNELDREERYRGPYGDTTYGDRLGAQIVKREEEIKKDRIKFKQRFPGVECVYGQGVIPSRGTK